MPHQLTELDCFVRRHDHYLLRDLGIHPASGRRHLNLSSGNASHEEKRRKQSVVPNAFWYFSVGGGLTLFAYAIYRRDPVFIIGQGAGLFVYARNLWFIHRTAPSAADH